jgi:hypothetical protein
VISGLSPQQRIDTPSTHHPAADAAASQRGVQLNGSRCTKHHLPSLIHAGDPLGAHPFEVAQSPATTTAVILRSTQSSVSVPSMRTWRAVTAAAALAATLVLIPAVADAQHVTVVDAPGDTGAPGLDITSVRFGNRDHAIFTTMTFTRDRPGKVIVAIGTKDQKFAAIIGSRHRQQGPDQTFLSSRRGAHRSCPGLASEWKRQSATLQLRLPARCVQRGNYGAIRAWLLTEPLHSGGDTDYAPETRRGSITFTNWIPRG